MTSNQDPPSGETGARPSDATRSLHDLRVAIENIDTQILSILRDRMALVEQVADVKLQAAAPIRDQRREEQLLRRIRAEAVDRGLDPHRFEQLYRLIIEASVAQQQSHLENLPDVPLRVAYQGVEGSYSHLTAQRRYAGRPGGVRLDGFPSFRAAADATRNGTTDVCLLPIENSTAGSIYDTYDILTAGGLVINAEEVTEVRHQLLGLPGSSLDGIRTVISHPQALAQCERFLRGLEGVQTRAEYDTAGAAQQVQMGQDRSVAAIASEIAATVFGLEILASDIQNQASNYTRFVELAPEAANPPVGAACKTSLMLATGHEPGDLADVLSHFARRRLNLTKLESRPRPETPWSYRFYLDVDGHVADAHFVETLEAIAPHTSELRVLGCFPKAPFVQPEKDDDPQDS